MKSKSGKKISFKGQATAAAAESAARRSGYGYLNLPKGLGVFSPEVGKSITLDFFPYEVTTKNHPDKHEGTGRAVKGSWWYKRPFKKHGNVGSDNETVVCPTSVGKPCPICEYKIKRAKEGAEKEELKSLKANDRDLYLVNPIDSTKHEAGKFYVMDISDYNFQAFLDKEMKDDVPDDFFDPEEGVSLKVRFAAETMGAGKPFAQADKITVVDRKKQYKEAFYMEAPSLDSMLTILSYDELEAKFFEVDKEEVDEDDAPRAKKTSKKVVEEDEEDEDETPVRKHKAVKKVEPEEEEEEEEVIAPPRKKKVIPEPEEEEEEEDSLTWDEISVMKEKELKNLIKANKLEADPDDFENDIKSFRKAVAKEMGIKIPKIVPTPEPIAKADRCPACKGTGKDEKGKMCKVCMGTGKKQVEPEDEEDDDLPFEKGKKIVPAKKGTAADECPSDHEFGKDVDKYDECDSCDLWDECMAVKTAKKKK